MAWVYKPRYAVTQVKQVLASSETIAQLKSIAASARAARAEVKLDVFGKPVDQVSPRVQRIRDLQAGKRVAPVIRTVSRGTYAQAIRKSEPVKSVDDTAKDMFKKLNDAIEDGEV